MLLNNLIKCAEVIEIIEDAEYDVYDIEVEGSHNFFANSINVHNSAEPNIC